MTNPPGAVEGISLKASEVSSIWSGLRYVSFFKFA